jgi:hypothetical protein
VNSSRALPVAFVERCCRAPQAAAARPQVDSYEASQQGFRPARQQLERLARLYPSDDVDDRGDDARGVAGGGGAGRRRLLEQASQAGRRLRPHRQRRAVRADAGAVHPRHALAHADVVDQEARLEVVGAVQHQVGRTHQFRRVVGGHVGDQARDAHLGVDRAQLRLRGRRLGQPRGEVPLVEEGLSLQVRLLEVVAVRDGQGADTRAGHHLGQRRAEGAAAHDQHAGAADPRLSLGANALEQLLP